MTPTTLLLVGFIVVTGVLIPGVIGAWVARRLGYDRRLGFAAGAVGSVAGWALMWLHAKRGSRPRTLLRTLVLVAGAALCVYLAVGNFEALVRIFLAFGWPERFTHLLLPYTQR
jgi:hypothetical protein